MKMNSLRPRRRWLVLAAVVLTGAGCATTPEPLCNLPDTHSLSSAFDRARQDLSSGCEVHFDGYLTRLLVIAEGDPSPDNKQRFSDFLLWSSDAGILSRRQAQSLYNRYFNIKFVTLMGDYNNCQWTCPRQGRLMADMENELKDKEQGLIKVALDKDSYYRADRLFQETELVLAATCTACDAAR